MRYLPNAEQMKTADGYTIDQLGIPSLELMERAAMSCVSVIEDHTDKTAKICVVCGSGNNGGDGFAIARILSQKGYSVSVTMVGNRDRCTSETTTQMNLAEQHNITIRDQLPYDEQDVIVDAVFGVGLSRNIEGRYRDVIEQMNAMSGFKLAVDIPSGVSADYGTVLGVAFRADMTVTFQAEKLGLLLYPGKNYAGQITVADIGITDHTFEQDQSVCYTLKATEYGNLLPIRREDSHKGSYGKLLIIAGSKGMSGAAYLNAFAAYTMGAGLVRIYTAEENRIILQTSLPEAIITAYETFDEQEVLSLLEWADAVCIGSGIGTDHISKKILKTVVMNVNVPCLIDADGLNILSKSMCYLEKKKHYQFVLTPHMKEMSRLSGLSIDTIKNHQTNFMDGFTKKYNLTCVLKDARTMVSGPGYRTYLNLSGNSAMAKAGSGDVLTGIIGGLLAQRVSVNEAAVLGVYLHGRAGDFARRQKGSYSVLARDLIEQLTEVLKEEEQRR